MWITSSITEQLSVLGLFGSGNNSCLSCSRFIAYVCANFSLHGPAMKTLAMAAYVQTVSLHSPTMEDILTQNLKDFLTRTGTTSV